MNKINKKLLKVLKLPEVRQVGIVVNSIDDTVKYYSNTFGLGPWFRTDFSDEEHNFMDKGKTDYEIDIALAFSGKIQLELIKPGEGDRNIHMDHLKEYGEGIHHLGFYVSDIEKRLDAIKELGIGVIQSGFLKSKGKAGGSVTTYAYLDTRKIGGIVFELIQTKFVGINIKMSRFWLELGAITGDVEKIRV